MSSRADALRKLMDAEASKEKECQEFLNDIALHLVPFRVRDANILVKGREESSRPGDSDFCVSIEVNNGAMGRRFAYIWEVKAPQKYLFQTDTANNRLRPTSDLYSAENQLLNYVAELELSKNFRQKFQLTGAGDEVRAGGIIIGRKDTMVKNLEGDSGLEGLARNAFTIREAYFWEPANFRVHTWDWVLEQLQNEEQGNNKSINSSMPRQANPDGLLEFAHEMLLPGDDLSFRAAVNAAYAAVELTVMSGGKQGGRGRLPQDVVRLLTRSAGRPDIAVQFRKLNDIRVRSAHVFDEPVSEPNAHYAVRVAEQLCSELNKIVAQVNPDEWLGIRD
ncbi:hypothetical protein [Paraburkholderia sp. J76]|uniref:hypothetical protein n=1 Tax=Paraburkholderia sp. J76 TaxID=2805439 RepID=UPI002ABD269E|nr:hypothetical protein [Paraburkholderia sp. J76]